MRLIHGIWNVLVTVSLATSMGVGQHRSEPSRTADHAAGRYDYLYVGTFTRQAPNGRPDGRPAGRGIYVARFDSNSGQLESPTLAAQLRNPTFLAASPNCRSLYAISEITPESFVTAFAIDRKSGKLHELDRVPTGGSGTAFVSTDRTGKFVLVANYGSGSIAVLRVNPDGSLGGMTAWIQHLAPRSQRGGLSNRPTAYVNPHPHAIVTSPDDRYLVVPDLGLNEIFVYRFDRSDGSLRLPATSIELPSNEGPRHFVFSPDGRFGYLIAQTTGNVIAFSWDSKHGKLTEIQSVQSLPKSLNVSNMSAEVQMTPNGRYLYESNRRTHGPDRDLGPDSIGVYKVDIANGLLTEVQEVGLRAAIPRCFSIDPSGEYIVVGAQQDNQVEVYRIDHRNGKLTRTGKSIVIHTPACMQFVPVS